MSANNRREEALQKLSDATHHLHTKKVKYDDTTEGGLIKCIKDYLTIKGHQVERVHCMGYPIPVGDGRTFRMGKTTMDKGTSDLHATVRGMSVKIEVKIGLDRLSKDQIEYRKRVEEAGGIYIIARTLEDFLIWFNKEFH